MAPPLTSKQTSPSPASAGTNHHPHTHVPINQANRPCEMPPPRPCPATTNPPAPAKRKADAPASALNNAPDAGNSGPPPAKRSRRRRHKAAAQDATPAAAVALPPPATDTPKPAATDTHKPPPNLCLAPDGTSPGIYFADTPRGRIYLMRWALSPDGSVRLGTPCPTANVEFPQTVIVPTASTPAAARDHLLGHDNLKPEKIKRAMSVMDRIDYKQLQRYAVHSPEIIAAWERHVVAVSQRDKEGATVAAQAD
ncbi:hypothetical protein DFH27DRAFT_311309 [Peziza echinospora]|nr:hypothetical protein DFH27DRAFT_311309 [Peziza echinospora]